MSFNWRLVTTTVMCSGFFLISTCVAYDITYFQSAWSRTRIAIWQHPIEDQHPPALAIAFIELSSHGDTVPYATRLLIIRGDEEYRPKSGISRQLKYATWCWLVASHLSESDRLSIIATFAVTGPQRHGLVETAEMIFGKQPSALSPSELAVLAILIQTPSISQDTQRQEKAAVGFLARYENSIYANGKPH